MGLNFHLRIENMSLVEDLFEQFCNNFPHLPNLGQEIPSITSQNVGIL
jgi:hypothetical protein